MASCEGNPFFAEQSARLVADQVRRAPVPASVQAVLAARLDALPPVQKALLGDAAVVGSVFWDGAVVEVGHRDPAEVDAALQDLIGKHLVRRVRRSSMLGENEYAFAHALAREVAYQELPRAVRAARHKDVAAWVESKAGDRVEDLAEILAHHYATALDLARAAGEVELADSCCRVCRPLPDARRRPCLAAGRGGGGAPLRPSPGGRRTGQPPALSTARQVGEGGHPARS